MIGSVTPSTNPSITVLGNGSCGMIAGNAMVFNGHPSAKECTAWAVDIFNEAVVEVGGPDNLVCTVAEPTKEELNVMMSSPDVKLLVGTGGPGMVSTLMHSGKRVIAAGAGNPPAIVDESADIPRAAKVLYDAIGYENDIMCITEKELFVVDSVFDSFIEELNKCGAYQMNDIEAAKVAGVCLKKLSDTEYASNTECVGKCACEILKKAGIEIEGDPSMAFFIAENDNPMVYTEQLMPIIPVVRCKDFEEAVKRAVQAEGGRKHSAAIWSNNIYHVTEFGRLIDTSAYVQNGSTCAAFGDGGTGRDSATIATPTGEGITNPMSFTRVRRFTMADGGNYLL